MKHACKQLLSEPRGKEHFWSSPCAQETLSPRLPSAGSFHRHREPQSMATSQQPGRGLRLRRSPAQARACVRPESTHRSLLSGTKKGGEADCSGAAHR